MVGFCTEAANATICRHPTKVGQIPIPRHQSQELKKGTERSILKDAGLD